MFLRIRVPNNNKRLQSVHIAAVPVGLKKICLISILLIFQVSHLFPQETGYGPGFRTVIAVNPAYAGSSGDGLLRLSYINFFPGNGYKLHSLYASYDSYFDLLHGGIGLWISNDYLGGIMNDTRGGISYAYALQAGEELFINAGLSASVFHRGLNYSNAVLPDMIDPIGGVVFPAGENLIPSSRTVLDIGTGFLIIYKDLFAGISLSHLSQPDLSEGERVERLKRKLSVNAAWSLPLNESGSLVLKPAMFLEFQEDHLAAAAGASAETRALGLNLLFLTDNAENLNLQAGFSVKAGKVGIYYNYRFNVTSGSALMPFSLLHQTGLTLGLNNVDKRNMPKAITLPEL